MIKKAGCILINQEKKEIALVYRKDGYSFPKGHLEENETIQECAVRETKEETGHNCHLLNDEEITIIHYKTDTEKDVEVHFFIAIDDGKTEDIIKQEDKEVTVWKKLEEVENTLSYQNLKELWAEIKDEINMVLITK